MSRSGCRRRSVATISRLSVPDPITTAVSPRRVQRSTAWSAVAAGSARTPRWSEMPSAGTSMSSWTRKPSLQPPPAFSLDPTDRPEQSAPPRSAFSQRWVSPARQRRHSGQALVGAAQGRLDEDAVALVRPAGRGGALHDADDLVAGDERAGGAVGGEHVRDGVAMDEREVGPADARECRADQHPAGAGRHRRPDVADLDRERRARLSATAPAAAPAAGAGVHEGRVDD